MINGTAAGGGYELALATDHIILADDGAAAVALPEVPLLAVLPGTGGLTRVVDKRKVRRDHADYFCTIEEGIKGKRAVAWRLVDEIVPNSKLEARVAERASEFAAASKRNGNGKGIALAPLTRSFDDNGIRYGFVSVDIDRAAAHRHHLDQGAGRGAAGRCRRHDRAGRLRSGRCRWRANSTTPSCICASTNSRPRCWCSSRMATAPMCWRCDAFLEANKAHWLVNEIRQYWKRVLKRIDVTSRTLVTLVEPGSCFVGTLAELVFAADRSYMLIGSRQGDNRAPPAIELSAMNFGPYPMSHGLTRLQSRFQADPCGSWRARRKESARRSTPRRPRRSASSPSRSTTSTGTTRSGCSSRSAPAFSPDSLTGMEANLRFVGPETMESKIFSRLTAWQNWIFQRPNAVGEDGALRRYGTGQKAQFDMTRV